MSRGAERATSKDERVTTLALAGLRTAALAAFDALPQVEGRLWDIEAATTPTQNELAWPIRSSAGSAVGALLIAPPGMQAGDVDEAVLRPVLALLGALLASETRAVLAALEASEALAAAMSDQMTGLANVRAWRQALRREERRCERSGVNAAVAMIDLDDLKVVNDTQGHLAGDLLLRLAADSLKSATRGSDLVARLGGDEFGVLAVDYEADGPEPLVKRLSEQLEVDEVRASVGAAVHVAGSDIMRTAHLSDVAMYEEKHRRKALAMPIDLGALTDLERRRTS